MYLTLFQRPVDAQLKDFVSVPDLFWLEQVGNLAYACIHK